jgi:Zn-dependent peptidase ImmA (M78 family)/DNA-binding XRE family transcriptional regulator
MSELQNKIMITIGKRLKQTRENLGYTQEQVAEKLGIGRPRYSDIENGKRDVPLKELYAFCEFFAKPLDYFFKEEAISESGFKVLFRKTADDHEVTKVVTEFENLCDRMNELEEITEVKIRPNIVKDYDYDKNRISYWGKYCAEQERSRLNLGLAPLKDLDRILEEKCRLKIFYLPIPVGKSIWGMFTYQEGMGGCILVNSTPVAGKQLFSLAHEYGHFIFHKMRLGVISSDEDKDTSEEKIADYFAREFLMPENTVNDIFNMRVNNRRDVTAEDVVYLADYFGVSFQAMIYRLNSLRLLNDDKKERFKDTWVNSVRQSMGISEPERSKSKFPPLYIHLCLKAYQQERITTAKFAEFLELPLYKAMELGSNIKRSSNDKPADNI